MYINYDSNYNENVLSDSRKWNVYRIAYYNDGSWSSIANANKYLRSFNLSDNSSDGSNITMGYVCGSKIVLEFKNAPATLVNSFAEGTQIILYLSLKGKETDTYSSQLNTIPYVIDEAKVVPIMSGRNITITAYDLSYLMTHEYVSAYENPTAIQMVTEIATKYGLTVDSSVSAKIAELGSSPSSMTFKPLNGFTCKQTLGFIAGCFGCNARVGIGRKIYFEWYETSSMPDIGKDIVYLGGSALSEKFVVKLIETGTSENPIVYPNNTSGYSINFENPYITADLARLIYDNKIANNKISFRSGKVKYKGNPINTSGKIVTTTDVDNASVSFYIMKRTLNYDGGLSETIECFGESETTINYKVNSPTQQRINRALSKMEDAIKAATDVITQTKGSIFELIPVDENDATKGNAGFKIHYEDTGSSAFDDCVIMGTAGGVGLSTNNGETFATAMYFYQDEAGEIHGAINGEVIRAGSISADKIDTSQLVVSKENVDGLDAELEALLQAAEGAEEKANTAQSTASTANSNASSALSKANTASTNASNALSVANTANGVIANWAYNNNTTVIDGSKIYTGTITAKQIASESITTDKLSVGTGIVLNQYYNAEFYDGTRGWIAEYSTLQAMYAGQSVAHVRVIPNRTTGYGLYQKMWLEKGRRYAIVAQILPLNWSRNASTNYIRHILGSNYTASVGQNLSTAYNDNGETVIKIVYDYTGETGFTDVGVAFRGLLDSSSNQVSVNIAWMAFVTAEDEIPGFYCSRKSWLASGYKESNYLSGSVGGSTTAESYLTRNALSVDTSGNLITLGTIKSDSGEIGSMVFNPERMDIATHSYYMLGTLSAFFSSRISFINPLKYTEFSTSGFGGLNGAEDSKDWSARIEVASSGGVEGIEGSNYTMITSTGVSTNDGSSYAALTASGIDIDGVKLTKSDLTALKNLL